MTRNQTDRVRESVKAGVLAEKHLIEKIIEGPFTSMFAATAATAGTFTFVISGIWFVSVLLG